MVERMNYQEFETLMDLLSSRLGKGDLPPEIKQMYFSHVALRCSYQHVLDGYEKLFDSWSLSRLPSPEEWREAGKPLTHTTNHEAYRVKGGADPLMLPEMTVDAAQEKVLSGKEKRLLFLAGVFESGGDSKFYRALLEGRNNGYAALVAKLTGDVGQITHEEVMAQVERNWQAGQGKGRRVA